MQKEFVETFDMYAERAVAEGACETKTDFNKMYMNRDYKYTEEYIDKIKESYLKGGASSIVNAEAIENAFDTYGTVGRGRDGNFTTSCIEDNKLCFDENGIKSASDIAQIKGVGPNTYKSGMYQYEYAPQFVKSCNEAGVVCIPNGDTVGASSLNIPGCKTWAGYNMEYSESELMMPSIKTEGFDSDDVFSAIVNNGFFEIKNPTVLTSDGTEMVVEGKFRINKLGD